MHLFKVLFLVSFLAIANVLCSELKVKVKGTVGGAKFLPGKVSGVTATAIQNNIQASLGASYSASEMAGSQLLTVECTDPSTTSSQVEAAL